MWVYFQFAFETIEPIDPVVHLFLISDQLYIGKEIARKNVYTFCICVGNITYSIAYIIDLSINTQKE